MIISVHDIPITGKAYDADVEHKDLDVKLLAPIHFKGLVYKSGEDVHVDAQLTTCVEANCDRCLEPFPLNINTNMELFYAPASKEIKKAEMISGDLGMLYYQDNTIDLSIAIRDTIIIEIPMKLLCKEDCHGLCVQCGKNLNLGPCGCDQKEKKYNPFQELLQKHKSN